ncbi:hypothetical protein KUTeg_011564, partial [Tegillarca granosa]
MSRGSNSILSEIEWDEGLSMPKKIVGTQNELEEIDDRLHAMSEHLKNVRQELSHTQGLTGARKHEIETENHLLKIAEREEGRLKQEIQKLEQELEDLKERKNVFENNIFRQTQKLEEMKSQMNWDQQALEAWLEESARKDEDSMAIQKMERLTDESQQKRKVLDHETTETLTAQIELDKTAEDFRRAHVERQELITQWEYTIEQMQRRDKEMDLLAAQLARVKAEVRKREESIKEKQQFLENEIENNKEQEKKISIAERVSAKTRIDYQEAETQRVQFHDEMAKDLRETLVEKLKIATESTLSAEERAARMDEMLQEEERNQQEIDTQLKYLRDLQFRKTEELHQAKAKERNIEAEIQGSQAAIRNLNSKISKLDTDSLKQQEIIYNQDFSVQQLERRINRMQGERSNEEKIALEAKIATLTEELEQKNNTHTLLTLQLKRLQDDIRRVRRELEKSGAEKGDLTSKIEELNLYNDTSESELRKIIKAKQYLMVDENIMKLELKRLREMLNEKADEVLSLEKRRLQLETAMKERRQEIQIHKDMLQAQYRAGDEERQQISAELHERISKIDKLRKRYEILMVSMAPPEGEEERSQAYYVIKAAQEKEELQREGDDLDAKIRKAEKEIRALENTLKLMNNRNETYRKSDEMEEKQQLEEQMRAVMDKYKYKRRQIRELQEDLQTMSNTLDNLVRDEGAYNEIIDEKKNKILQLQKELEDQHGKLERVAKTNAKYARELRSAKKSKGELPEERDFHVRELREFNKTVMSQIAEVVNQHQDMSDVVNLYFQQANLPPPTPTGRHPGSARSSLSSVRGSPASVRSPPAVSGRPTPVQIGADIAGLGSPASSRSSSSMSSVRSGRIYDDGEQLVILAFESANRYKCLNFAIK